MLNKLLNWFRRPKWEEFRDGQMRILRQTQEAAAPYPALPPGEQWRTNFSLTAAQRSERTRKGNATRWANKQADRVARENPPLLTPEQTVEFGRRVRKANKAKSNEQ